MNLFRVRLAPANCFESSFAPDRAKLDLEYPRDLFAFERRQIMIRMQTATRMATRGSPLGFTFPKSAEEKANADVAKPATQQSCYPNPFN